MTFNDATRGRHFAGWGFVPPPPSTSAKAASLPPAPEHCEYTSKHCSNPRALKPNGQFHRLCDFHRKVANENQRRWQNRKRTIKAQDGKRHQELMRKYPKLMVTGDVPVSAARASPKPRTVHTLPSLERELPTLLPRLHQHHILSRALLMPVAVKQENQVGMDSSQLLWHSQDRSPQRALGLSGLRPSI